MTPLQALVLGIVQGVTEFAPVSSSAHLVLVPWVLGWPSPGVAFDAVLHLGTLLAVLLVFAPELAKLAAAWIRSLIPPFRASEDTAIAWLLLLATIPGVLAGLFLEDIFERMFNSPWIVGVFLLVTAMLLSAADIWSRGRDPGYPRSIWKALVIGAAQAAAIAPGISRSGATISAGMLLGLSRPYAARFSFLLSAPIVLGAGASQFVKLARHPDFGEQQGSLLLIGFLAAAISGYLCIKFLLAYLGRHGLRAFAAYCLVAGLFTLAISAILK